MKKLIILGLFGLFFCNFFIGCHTLDTLSKVNTGHVGPRDLWEAVIADDRDFQENFW